MNGLDKHYASFYNLVTQLDTSLLKLWDREEHSYRVREVEEYLKVCSSEQEVLISFLMMFWLGRNEFDFDLFNAFRYLNQNQLNIIGEWIKSPNFYCYLVGHSIPK